ncbi:unnamed protein product [Kuraishia capsulata CBS 1993]|uniref:Uncharacterized protein n=1 Tax=Kuraishia capsulata CBS 1993 TaxID=1382522 RepID=W6MQU8_9ASCO|nr:uncharacterized protein KUCA_T00003611001 [Kuraishia capsulata CBS 1993]CDK27632.1 unnamed protein product [Kuraishia capsulata CBS 1993]
MLICPDLPSKSTKAGQVPHTHCFICKLGPTMEDTWFAKENGPSLKVFLTTSPLDAQKCIDFVKDPGAGAVVYFGGTTRDSFGDREVVSLSYEAHRPMALRSLVKISNEAITKFKDFRGQDSVQKVCICHRLGTVPVLEESIVIALSSTHRKEGWEAAMYILERIKESVEIWKSEEYADGGATWKENGKEHEKVQI